MGEEVKPAVIRKTQDSLGRFIKRPPLTDKLLRKPPFRFLHDIITAVIRQHGLMEGLFTADEMVSDNVKDKERKIAFLQKVIDTMKLLTGAQLTVRPSKIVAGLEAERTNELLQAIAKALERKLNSKKAVAQVLAKAQGDNETPAETTKASKGSSKTTNKEVGAKSKSSRDGSKTRETAEVNGKPRKKPKEKKAKEEEVIPAVNEENAPSAPELSPEPQPQSLPAEAPESLPAEPPPEPQASSGEQSEEPVVLGSQVNDPQVLGAVAEEPPQPSVERPPSVTPSRVPTAIVAPPRPPSVRPGSARPRPITARPAAPRLKERLVRPAAQESEPATEIPVTTGALIPDSAKDDDDEVFVVEDATPAPEPQEPPRSDLDVPEQAGHLVTQILGTQRELEQHEDATNEPEVAHWAGGREAARREVGKLRDAVQGLVRAANPLGRLLDFLQEDVEAMQLELEHWQTENSQLRAELIRETRITDDSLAPLQKELASLQTQTEQQRQALAVLKTSVWTTERRLMSILMD